MVEQRLDNQSLVPPECPLSFRACRRSAMPVGGLASVILLAAGVLAGEPENLAPKAQVSATSEYSPDYAARPSDEQLGRFPEPPEEPAVGPPWVPPPPTPGFEKNPYEVQVDAQLASLVSEKAETRSVAIGNLSLMRAYQAADQVAARLADSSTDVRREAAMSLGRIGSRRHLEFLLAALDDEHWSVRQAAWVSLSNLTGQESPFDALGAPSARAREIAVWRQWVASFRADQVAGGFVSLSPNQAPWLRRERLAKALGAIGQRGSAVPALVSVLRGYTGRESNDRAERLFVQACIRSLGRLGGEQCVPLLVRYLNNERNAMEISYAAAKALADLRTPAALAALERSESSHPIHNVRLVAREALQQQGVACQPRTVQEKLAPVAATPIPDALPKAIVFIKGPKTPPNYWFFSPTLQAYNQTDEGPTHRVGFNIYRLQPPEPVGKVTQLTHFNAGFVADLRVSYDGRPHRVCPVGGFLFVAQAGVHPGIVSPRRHGPPGPIRSRAARVLGANDRRQGFAGAAKRAPPDRVCLPAPSPGRQAVPDQFVLRPDDRRSGTSRGTYSPGG